MPDKVSDEEKIDSSERGLCGFFALFRQVLSWLGLYFAQTIITLTMRAFFLFLFTSFLCSTSVNAQTIPEVSGELKKWHKVTLTFEGPSTSENHTYNPFLNYRLNVTFRNADRTYVIPGYYAADGGAGESSADEGDKWRVHFAPDAVGEWFYEVSFREGSNVAVAEAPLAGESAGYSDGYRGSMTIGETDKTGLDLRGKGRLQYVNEPYLKFAETGEYFLKAGADAPENLLSYADFDGDFKTDGHKDDLVKTWSAHLQDWKGGDPTWQGGKGKALIGAVNYLASKGMNAFSFLPMNIAGDDKNVFPYISYDVYDRMDVSKLDQWEVLFEHGDKMGMFLHFKLSEVENQGLLDNGDVGVQRRLYYRELIARFGHHLALNWNIGEENGLWVDGNHITPWQTTEQRLDCARYFFENDPYRHHVVIHNGQDFHDLLGPSSKYTGLSLQTNKEDFSNVHPWILKWRRLSKEKKKNWAIAIDEPGDHRYSLVPDAKNPTHDNARQNALWGALMAGAWGIEWYFGYENEHSDLTCEDWRSRDKMWTQSKHALDFFNQLPFWEMEPIDEATSSDNDFVFAKKDAVYVVYMKMGDKPKSVLEGVNGTYNAIWHEPISGMSHGPNFELTGNGSLELPKPPKDQSRDWILLLTKE